MIYRDILADLMPLKTSIDSLTTRFHTCESRRGTFSKIMALKAEFADLRKNVDI